MTAPPPRAVTFDATGTLFHVPRLADIYGEVLARHGVDVPRRDLAGLIPRVWQELACAVELGSDRFAAHPEGARGWWRRFLERLCEHLGVPPASPFAAAELYARFARGDAYRVFPEVPRVLAELSRRGVPMGVVSNWDDRLTGVLEDLGLARWLDFVVVSYEVGVEKPHPAIFERALARLGLPPEQVLHVGDRVREDVEGALALGMEALLLVRPDTPEGRKVAAASGGGGDLADLSPLPDLVAAPGAGRAGGRGGGPEGGSGRPGGRRGAW
jgi:putative hydrolase of the HAD superfamily